MGDVVKLCNELQIALEGECVFYGTPQRRRGEPVQTRRLFKLNRLWFEAKTEKRTELHDTRKNPVGITPLPGTPSWDMIAETIMVERIVSIDLVMSHDVGVVSMPRPAIVMPGLTNKGNVTFDDCVVNHRHMVIGNHAPIRAKFAWNATPLNEERPWVRPGAAESMAISEYEAEVRKLRAGIEDKFAAVLIEIRARERAALAKSREADDLCAAADNPLWGSW